jgi:hypothetical protein
MSNWCFCAFPTIPSNNRLSENFGEEAAAAIKSLQSGDTWRLLQRLLQ